MSTENQKAEQRILEVNMDDSEKLVIKRIVEKFREWYATISPRELSKNKTLSQEIAAFEGLFRAALL